MNGDLFVGTMMFVAVGVLMWLGLLPDVLLIRTFPHAFAWVSIIGTIVALLLEKEKK